MKRATLRLSEDTPGWEEGGLFLHKASPRGSWRITHIASGKYLDTFIDSAQQGRQILEALLELGVDFHQDEDYLEVHAEEIHGVISKKREELGLTKLEYVKEQR